VSKARILVLGATGFLGWHLVRAAEQDDDLEVVALERSPDAARRPPNGRATWLARDLDEPAAEPAGLVAETSPELVVNALALSRLGACAADPGRARHANAWVPGLLARACASQGRRLVHVSTDLVFGGQPPPAGGFREEDPPDPVSAYGRSKAEGERRVQEEDPRALVCRLPLLFGDSGGRGLGASDSVLTAVAAGERVRLFADEWRTPLDVGDAARALLELARGTASGLLHVAGPERLSRVELGRRVLAASGLAVDELVHESTRSEAGMDGSRPEDCSLDASRARALLRTPLRSLEAALVGPA